MAITVDLLFSELSPLLKAYAAKYPERCQGTGLPSLAQLQLVRCSKPECKKPRKDYMDPLPCAWCEEHMPAVVDLTETPPPPAKQEEAIPPPMFKTPMPTLVGSKALRDKASYPSLRPKKPVKRRLTYEEEKEDYYRVEDPNKAFYKAVHVRYQKDHRWLRRVPPDIQTISNNLTTIEVHLQQLRDQSESSEEHVLNKIAALGERQFELQESLHQVVESINRIDDSIDAMQDNIRDLCKIVDELMN